MRSKARFFTVAALALAGLTFVSCQNDNNSAPSAGYNGGMSGGGSTDTYGTSDNARYRSTGNIGMDTGAGGAAGSGAANGGGIGAPAPAGGNAGTPGQPAPGQTPLNNGSNGGVTNSGTGEGSLPSSAGSSNSPYVPANTNGPSGGGSVLGGTGGNGSPGGPGAGR